MAHHSLNEQVPVRVFQWEVQETGSDRYVLEANYSFELDGRVYHGNTLFAEPIYLNQSSAIAALREQAIQPWSAWFDHADPTHSSLEKIFPEGLLVRALVSSAVFLYFILFHRKKSGSPLH